MELPLPFRKSDEPPQCVPLLELQLALLGPTAGECDHAPSGSVDLDPVVGYERRQSRTDVLGRSEQARFIVCERRRGRRTPRAMREQPQKGRYVLINDRSTYCMMPPLR